MGQSIQQLAREDGMLVKTSSSECLIDKMFVSAGTTLQAACVWGCENTADVDDHTAKEMSPEMHF